MAGISPRVSDIDLPDGVEIPNVPLHPVQTIARGHSSRKFGLVDEFTKAAPTHVAIVGAGFVGTNTAFALLLGGYAAKVTLTDVNTKKCEGEVLDLEDGGGNIDVATPQEAGQADIIVITAGRGQRDGETRLDLIKANSGIIKSIINGMQPIKRTAKIIVVSNPCDPLTYVAQKYSGLPQSQVFGSGTVLDSRRLRVALADKLHVHHSSVIIWVLGEHGDSQFPAASVASVGGIPLKDVPGMEKIDVFEEARNSMKKAYEIISRKGYTAYGVAMAVARIVSVILNDQQAVLPVAVRVPGRDCVLSLPAVIGIHGVERILDVTAKLDDKEQAMYQQSLQAVEAAMKSLD